MNADYITPIIDLADTAFDITSVKGATTFIGSIKNAVVAALALEAALLPRFGVNISQRGILIINVTLGKITYYPNEQPLYDGEPKYD